MRHNTISIHAPRAGRDCRFCAERYGWGKFQSTRPVRGATGVMALCPLLLLRISIHAPRAGRDWEIANPINAYNAISIHAPRAGRDPQIYFLVITAPYFNPRAPCGARRDLIQ